MDPVERAVVPQEHTIGMSVWGGHRISWCSTPEEDPMDLSSRLPWNEDPTGRRPDLPRFILRPSISHSPQNSFHHDGDPSWLRSKAPVPTTGGSSRTMGLGRRVREGSVWGRFEKIFTEQRQHSTASSVPDNHEGSCALSEGRSTIITEYHLSWITRGLS